jgi:hypothetical protein
LQLSDNDSTRTTILERKRVKRTTDPVCSYLAAKTGSTLSMASVGVDVAIPMIGGTTVLWWAATPSTARRMMLSGRRGASAVGGAL